MGMLKLNRLLTMERQRRRRQSEYRNGCIASQAERKDSVCQQDENFLGGQIKGHSEPNLPEDIWCHIHSLMPMRDAARVACVSRAFSRSWRCHPKLEFSEEALGLNGNQYGKIEKARDFTSKVDYILEKHSGIGLKVLKLQIASVYDQKDCCHLDHLDSWLQIAVKPGIEELNLCLPLLKAKYNFPCLLLSNGTGDSLRHLLLSYCNFHPTVELGCLRSLTRLQLCMVNITGYEIECLLSNSFALEQLELKHCSDIICLKIPCLQWLSHLEVLDCIRLKVIESKAPNLSSFRFAGGRGVQLLLGETLRVKRLERICSNGAFYARTELPSSMPYLETLAIYSEIEKVNTPMVPSRFHHLKFLSISLAGQSYDYFSLVSFFDASPSLESFFLNVFPGRFPGRMGHVSIFEDSLDLRKMPEHSYNRLKSVNIVNFSSAKSLVELTCHILSLQDRWSALHWTLLMV